MLARSSLLVAALAVLGASGAPASLDYPATKTVDVTTDYFGTKVRDPYRWLEDARDPSVRAWAAAQRKVALAYLERSPSLAAYRKRVTELEASDPYREGLVVRGGRLFYERHTPPQPQPDLVVLDHIGGDERVLYHPVAGAGGNVPALSTVAVSGDGTKVAYTTQIGGSGNETLHVVDVASATELTDVLTHVGGGDSPVAVAWDGDGKGFIHTQWPRSPDGTYAISGILIYHHVLGTDPAMDTYVFGKGLSPTAEFTLATAADGTMTAASVVGGDGQYASIYLREGDGPFTLVATPDDRFDGTLTDGGGAFVGDAYFAISKKRNSLGEIVALRPGRSFDSAPVIVPASNVVIKDIVPLENGFATDDVDGGDSSARLFDSSGKFVRSIPIPPVSRASIASDPSGGPIVIQYDNYTTDDTWLAYDENTAATTVILKGANDPQAWANIVVDRVFVPSLDGRVKIPLEIMHSKNARMDGTAPTVLTAYGAYGTIGTPNFNPARLARLERGGVFAHAMIRGGGEYGDAWHLAAHFKTKTVSSDDLAACAMWLGAHGFGTRRHLGIVGQSGGGFLMGLALTRNPSLYRAVVATVGVLDLLRFELTPNGAYNTAEFGTVKDPAQFAWMVQQSPYHNVREHVAYPAILMSTGENDPLVDPYNSRKMVAALQADTSSRLPVLLVQNAGQGHGLGHGSTFAQENEAIAESYAFLEQQLR